MAATSSTFTSDHVDEFSRSYDFINLDGNEGSVGNERLGSASSSTRVNRDVDPTNSNYTWLGKLAVNALMANCIVRELPDLRDTSQLDLLLARANIALSQAQSVHFPAEVVDRSSTRPTLRQPANWFHTLLGGIGNMMVRDDEAIRQRVNTEIHRLVESDVLNGYMATHLDFERHPRQPTNEMSPTRRPGGPAAMDERARDMQAYSIALFEYAQDRGDDITLSYEQIGYRTPPYFRASLSFQTRTYSGHGSSKKMAKHMAARDACEFLDIPISGS
ncbi:hypothetical protein CAC42_5459 [Sphaceloma murrayae]|uniref:DRBM domain-containing protein n=1 Tax=Sphaceloma murrayae TaxID=2082308 RepID=A0A2K1QJF3_9PEZI|nr:hypothetical protein CAC42_5459 [Sphaceloma murrayae]